jgi:hypothetical protein
MRHETHISPINVQAHGNRRRGNMKTTIRHASGTHGFSSRKMSLCIEIAPGVQFSAWTFGDQVPGPVIQARVGDRIKFSMTNRSVRTFANTSGIFDGRTTRQTRVRSRRAHCTASKATDENGRVEAGRQTLTAS